MDVRSELHRFDPGVPLDQASTPPASWYTSAAFHALELERVFRCNLLAVARADQVRSPGDYVTACVGADPLLLARGGDGVLRGFGNACRHHGTRVADGAGNGTAFTCPYHGWTYDLCGALQRAPGAGGMRVTRASMGLTPVHTAASGPLLFACVDPPRVALPELLGPVPARLGDLTHLSFRERRVYPVRCNWKVFADNYLDGGYHVAHLHGALAAQLDLASYRTEVYPHGSVQTCAGSTARIGSGAVYAFVYPNLMLNRYGRVLDVNVVLPGGPEQCEVVFDWYLEEGAADAEVAAAVAESERVQHEDMAVCERVQDGLRSRFFDRGRYAPASEAAMHAFHCRLRRDLAD